MSDSHSLATYFPPLGSTPISSMSSSSQFTLADVVLLVSWSSLFILLWDWATHFQDEVKLVWKSKRPARVPGASSASRLRPGVGAMKWTFLISRYLAIVQAVFAVFLLTIGRHDYDVCDLTRLLPFGFSVVSFSVHLVMSLRMYGLYGQNVTLVVVLGVLSVVDLVAQIVADGFVQPMRVALNVNMSTPLCTCFIMPSSPVFALAFLSPTAFHHLILGLTLWKCYQHASAERVVGSNVVKTLRRGHVGYVLTICLVNFANVILVLQTSSKAYRLINFLPSLTFTQIFLGRIFFSLRRLALTPSAPALNTPEFTHTNESSTLFAPNSPNSRKRTFLRGKSRSRSKQDEMEMARIEQGSTIEIRLEATEVREVEKYQQEHGLSFHAPVLLKGDAKGQDYEGFEVMEEELTAPTIRRRTKSGTSSVTSGNIVFVGHDASGFEDVPLSQHSSIATSSTSTTTSVAPHPLAMPMYHQRPAHFPSSSVDSKDFPQPPSRTETPRLGYTYARPPTYSNVRRSSTYPVSSQSATSAPSPFTELPPHRQRPRPSRIPVPPNHVSAYAFAPDKLTPSSFPYTASSSSSPPLLSDHPYARSRSPHSNTGSPQLGHRASASWNAPTTWLGSELEPPEPSPLSTSTLMGGGVPTPTVEQEMASERDSMGSVEVGVGGEVVAPVPRTPDSATMTIQGWEEVIERREQRREQRRERKGGRIVLSGGADQAGGV
ncbi:hypothetical protein MNV49_006327 [Pseudohyphozyma bogoriensis]|nr:hypothetical protein MNV49_006327 [Pseudohyphozyma bogoriensis]